MTMTSVHYSGLRIKRSLLHFIIGKLAQALAGITFLILLVRHMASDNYGAYVALLAVLDIFYLVSGLGLSTIAQRYVAEFRMKASSRRLLQFLNHLFLKRAGYSLVFVVLLLLTRQWLLPLIGLDLHEKWLLPLALLLITSASVFFLDEVLGALLFQGLSQSLAFFRSVIKLFVLFYYLHYSLPITIEWALILECGVTLTSLIIGHFIFRYRIGMQLSQPDMHDSYESPAMTTTARKFYGVQLVGQL
ncbi:MAG: hypothetical protein Q7S51_05515, partial [Gallionellaceae bacterium]|nr:hypothetical protein [Gallionellaceae bacterium]